jgi:flagellin
MALSLHTNYASLSTQNQLGKTNNMLSTAMQRLGTGLRINSASDDAAGLQIASRLQTQSNGQKVGMRNAQNAISMLQTADGALSEITSIGQRMKDIAIQANSGTNGASEFAAFGSEYTALMAEVTNVIDNTQFGEGKKLFATTLTAAVTFQIGSSAAEEMSVDVSAKLTAVTGAQTALVTISDQATGKAAVGLSDALLTAVGELRGDLGASINRLDHTINNLGNMNQNIELSKGRIMDADFAAESGNMTKQQLLMQSGMSVLGKANQVGGMVMGLLR